MAEVALICTVLSWIITFAVYMIDVGIHDEPSRRTKIALAACVLNTEIIVLSCVLG